MKKFLIVIGCLLVIFSGFVIYDMYFKDRIPVLDIEEEKVDINKLYVYGTHLNMEGSYKFSEKADLVLYNGEFISYEINEIDGTNNTNDTKRMFNLSDMLNGGIYLDDIPVGDYYLFLRVKYMDEDSNKKNDDEEESFKYYSLVNKSEYPETTYYTMSKYGKRIDIVNEGSYPTMMIRVKENNDKDVYDIVIDPGHGGMDGGASMNGYKETDFTMDMAIMLKNKLEEYGFSVKLTHEEGQLSLNDRLDEYGVHGRAVVSSEVKAKYLVSLHLNSSSSPSVNGIEVYTAKNIDYGMAKNIVKNVVDETGLGYSKNKINKIYDGIYSRNFTQENIDSSMEDYDKRELVPYEITTNSNYYYMIRETGGIVTGAYVDDRNSEIVGNPYVKSNVGTEAYLLELGYLSNKKDLDNVRMNMDKYVLGIANGINYLNEDMSS